MDELKKINNKIAAKQIGRIAGGIGSMILGMILIEKFTYQKGITDSQRHISEVFPDEYAAMTEKIVKAIEEH